MSVPSSELAPPPLSRRQCVPPLDPKGGNTRMRIRGLGGANSDDWRESLALCIQHSEIQTIFPVIFFDNTYSYFRSTILHLFMLQTVFKNKDIQLWLCIHHCTTIYLTISEKYDVLLIKINEFFNKKFTLKSFCTLCRRYWWTTAATSPPSTQPWRSSCSPSSWQPWWSLSS